MNRTLRRHDVVEMRRIIEEEGVDAALEKFPRRNVIQAARILGKLPKYHTGHDTWNPEWSKLFDTELTDTEISLQTATPVSTVRMYRRFVAAPSPHKRRTDKYVEMAAKLTDDDLRNVPLPELEQRTQIPTTFLRRERYRRKIRISRHYEVPKKAVGVVDLRRAAVRGMRDTFPHVTLQEMADVLHMTREGVRQVMLTADKLEYDWTDNDDA